MTSLHHGSKSIGMTSPIRMALCTDQINFIYAMTPDSNSETATAATTTRTLRKVGQKCTCKDRTTGKTYNFCYEMKISTSVLKIGSRFSCSHIARLRKLNLLSDSTSENDQNTRKNGSEGIISKNENVFITGASSNHFAEILHHLANLQQVFGEQNNSRFIFYDLGNYSYLEYFKESFSLSIERSRPWELCRTNAQDISKS